jgi:choice-of-anchor C domain-containing protein
MEHKIILVAILFAVIMLVLQNKKTTNHSAPGNLLQNGSFESGPNPGYFLPLSPGSKAINNWTVIRGGIDYYGTGWVSSDGNRSLDLNGTPGVGGVAQTFATTSGQKYRVSFDMAGHPSRILQKMRVCAAGQLQDFTFQSGADPNNLGWQRRTWDFTANAPQTTLEFYSLQKDLYPYGGPALDNVVVTRISQSKNNYTTSPAHSPQQFTQEKSPSLPPELAPRLRIGPWVFNDRQPSGDISTNFIGTWTGNVREIGTSSFEYPVMMMIRPGKLNMSVGSVHYLALDCGGELLLTSASSKQISVKERLNTGLKRCVDHAVVTLSLNTNGSLNYSVRAGNESASAVLKRLE